MEFKAETAALKIIAKAAAAPFVIAVVALLARIPAQRIALLLVRQLVAADAPVVQGLAK